MKAFINSCIEANKEIYEYITTHISTEDYNYSGIIGEGGDNSLNMDLKAEAVFVKHLNTYGSIYSEESGVFENKSDNIIVIDPLDGSDNFVSGLPYYGTSVALNSKGKTIAAMVCNLSSGDIIYKIKDENIIYQNLFKKNYTPHTPVNSKIALFERSYKFPEVCSLLYSQGIKYRSPGAVALSLATARNFDFVLFIGKMRSFDLDAGLFICEDLNVYKTDKILLVCKNECKFKIIKELLMKNRL
ncbi:MAG: inositol monophosphatase family protein [Candidatus Marinarcus sp.]|uniref:inositol monophosphatase family protein n=1 Tax=Candidatus Marinarcus sp. TaxID=3100987 RepID=UPI003AFF9934